MMDDDENNEVSGLISDLARKQRRAAMRNFAYTLVALFVGLLWIALSYSKVLRLDAERSRKQEEIERKSEEIAKKDKEIEDKTSRVEALDHLLKNTFFAGGDLKVDQDRVVKESDDAQTELTKIQSPTSERRRRRNIAIQYYSREIEKHYVDVAMERLGKDYEFRILHPRMPSEPNTPTNAVWLNKPGPTQEDVKLVLYYLTVAGVTIKYIGPPTSTCEKFKRISAKIIVLAEPKVVDEPPLGVDRIRGLSLAEMKSGTKKISCR